MKLTIEFDNDDLTDARCFLIRELFGVEKGRTQPAAELPSKYVPLPTDTIAAATVVVGDSTLENFNPPSRGRGRKPKVAPADPVPTPEPGGIPSARPGEEGYIPFPDEEKPVLDLTADMVDPAAIGGEDLTARPIISDRELGIAAAEAQQKYVGTPRGETIGSELRALIGEYVPAGRHYHDIAQAARFAFLEKVRAL